MSAALTGTIKYDRQTDLLRPDVAYEAHATIFGCGTVGSNAAVELAKLGVGNFDLYDFDIVEPHNIPSQRFNIGDLGSNKAEATAAQLMLLMNDPDGRVRYHDTKVEGPMMPRGICILAVDSMESRELIYTKCLKFNMAVPLVMDFRMSGNLLQCFAFQPGDDRYESTLFSDEDAEPAPCGGRTVSYTGALAGCIAANYARKHLSGGSVPFTTSIDLEGMGMLVSSED